MDCISFGTLDKDHRGWAHSPTGSGVSHYIVGSKYFDGLKPSTTHKALCGYEFTTTDRIPLLHQGNWPSCKRCDVERKKLGLEGRQSAVTS